MAFDETLAARVYGVMCCGVHGDDLILRLDRDRATGALAAPHVRPMDLTGRPLRGFVTVRPEGFAVSLL
jgi:hypothetical protein